MQIQAGRAQQCQGRPPHWAQRWDAAQDSKSMNSSMAAPAVSTLALKASACMSPCPHSWLLHVGFFLSPSVRSLGVVSVQPQTPCNKFLTSPSPNPHFPETLTALKTQNDLNNKHILLSSITSVVWSMKTTRSCKHTYTLQTVGTLRALLLHFDV